MDMIFVTDPDTLDNADEIEAAFIHCEVGYRRVREGATTYFYCSSLDGQGVSEYLEFKGIEHEWGASTL